VLADRYAGERFVNVYRAECPSSTAQMTNEPPGR
jgi:hypothetical protein